jgi:hypothetical protein
MVNTDGSTNYHSLEARSRYIIHNDHGEFVQAGCLKHSDLDDHFINEVLVSKEGIGAATTLGKALHQ